MESFGERALIPFVFCRLAALYSFARVNDPARPDAAANGQFLMLRRDVYEAIGGHASVAGQILEDVALARRVKQAGYTILFHRADWSGPHADVSVVWRDVARLDEESLSAGWRQSRVRCFWNLSRQRRFWRRFCFSRRFLCGVAGHASWAHLVPVLVAGLLLYGHLRYAIALHPESFSDFLCPILYSGSLPLSGGADCFVVEKYAWRGGVEGPGISGERDVLGNPWFA